MIELALNEFYRARYEAMHDWAERAVSAARGARRRAADWRRRSRCPRSRTP